MIFLDLTSCDNQTYKLTLYFNNTALFRVDLKCYKSQTKVYFLQCIY